MSKLPESVRIELEEIELPWLELQASRGKVKVHGVYIQERLKELRKILKEDSSPPRQKSPRIDRTPLPSPDNERSEEG
jgi:hypothetical protein